MPTKTHALAQGANASLRRLKGLSSERSVAPSAPGRERAAVRHLVNGGWSALGLTRSEYVMLGTLMGYTATRDWRDGWPLSYMKNQTLCRKLDHTEPYVSRLIASLERKGFVTRTYAKNGRRYGIRDAAKRLIDGRGIDLSPLLHRFEELKELVQRRADELDRKATLARGVTEHRLVLQDTARDMLGSFWDDDARRFLAAIASAVPDEHRYTRDLRRLSIAALEAKAMELAAVEREMTTLLETEFCSEDEEAVVDHSDNQQTRANPNLSLSRTVRSVAKAPVSVHSPSAHSDRKRAEPMGSHALLRILPRALPTFWGRIDQSAGMSVYALQEAAMDVLRDIGLRQSVFYEWMQTLSPVMASLIAALVYEKAHSSGPNRLIDTERAGGYFVSCCRRAVHGEMHIAASLYACAHRNEKAGIADDDDLI